MDLEIIWSEFAEKQLDEIFEYYTENVNIRVGRKVLRNLLKAPEQLKSSPFIGQTENLLTERKNSYRYLIHKNYKIIYSVDPEDGFIKIADIFDTRQNPEKIKRTE